MELVLFMGTLFILLALGVPVFLAMGACSVVLMIYLGFVDSALLAQRMVGGVNNFVLMAIPFFVFAGEIMSRGGIGKRIVDCADVIIGRVRGGLGYTSIVQSIIFAGLSGSAAADCALSGKLLYPEMVRKGYTKERAMGLTCASSLISMIIPPSSVLIIFGVVTGTSITRLFMAGIVPGLLLGVVFLISWFFIARVDGYTETTRYTFKQACRLLAKSLPALFMPVLIIGGIRFGIFTPTEAGAFAVVYAIFVCLFIYRELTLKLLWECLVSTVKTTSIVMLIVSTASVVSWLIAIAQIPELVVGLLGPLIDRPFLLFLLINVFLLFVGMAIDMSPAIMIFAPMLLPVAVSAGMDPIAFGIIMILNLVIGSITPPVGVVLLLGVNISGLPYSRMVRGTLVFIAILVSYLMILTWFPAIITVPLGWIM